MGRKRPREAWDVLYGLNKAQTNLAKKALKNARNYSPDEEEEDPRQPSSQQTDMVSRLCYGRALRAQGRDYPAAIGVPRDLGHAEICQVINVVRAPQCNEDVLIGTMVFGLCNYPQLREAKVQIRHGVGVVKTKVRLAQKAPREKLSLKSSNVFARAMPIGLTLQFRSLRRKPEDFKRAWARMEGRLREISSHITIANFTHALVTHGESWLGLPWAVAEIAYRPLRRKYPAPRSYVSVGVLLLKRTEPLLRIFDPQFAYPEWWNFRPTGSRLCPATKNLTRFFRNWCRLLRPLRLKSPTQVLKHWNGLIAGVHLLFLLFCGLRNQPMDGPPLHLVELTDWDLIRQKLHVTAFWVPEQLRALLGRVRAILDHLRGILHRQGIELNDDRCRQWAYSFLDCSTTNHWSCVGMDNLGIVRGLAGCRGLRAFCGLDRKALRHWSSTVLRENGIGELEARLFHGHAEFMLHGLRRHRAEPVIQRQLLQRIANILTAALKVDFLCTMKI